MTRRADPGACPGGFEAHTERKAVEDVMAEDASHLQALKRIRRRKRRPRLIAAFFAQAELF